MEKQWNLPPFECESLTPNETRIKWEEWKSAFEFVAKASGEKDNTKLKCLLMAYGGFQLQKIFRRIPGADVEADVEKNINPYEVAINWMNILFPSGTTRMKETHSGLSNAVLMNQCGTSYYALKISLKNANLDLHQKKRGPTV